MQMPVERRAFRETLGQFANGVTVIAVEIDGTLHAMTANSFTSLQPWAALPVISSPTGCP
jgi:flavin reductase (DIM6/NTAB) family NADH-FMN oxidoreductase RutF